MWNFFTSLFWSKIHPFFMYVVILMVFLVGFSQVANAQTLKDLQGQLDSIFESISLLQEQINMKSSIPGGNSSTLPFYFYRNLKISDKGEDVKKLQIILNSNLKTRLATVGTGSPGYETDFFGELTENAVIKYQELFRSEILTPVNLSSGTGFVGPSTRAKLNKNSNPNSLSAPDGNLPENMSIAYLSKSPIGRGQELIIIGSGFGRSNTVQISDIAIKNVIPTETILGLKELRVIVPFELSIENHEIYILNETGVSNKTTLEVALSVINTPTISSITPSEGGPGTKVTIRGSGFSTESNTVHIGYDGVELPSRDGETLEFTIDYDPFGSTVVREQKTFQFVKENTPFWDLYFYVQNPGGVSNGMIFKFDY